LRQHARRRRRQQEEDAVDILFTVITIDTFWRILLFVHFLLALALLAAVTLQAAAVLMPARPAAGGIAGQIAVDRSPVPPQSYATLVVVLYVLQALVGAWIYVKYRTYVRIPMEELRQWWTVGSFEPAPDRAARRPCRPRLLAALLFRAVTAGRGPSAATTFSYPLVYGRLRIS
jgi:heme A synthase